MIENRKENRRENMIETWKENRRGTRILKTERKMRENRRGTGDKQERKGGKGGEEIERKLYKKERTQEINHERKRRENSGEKRRGT